MPIEQFDTRSVLRNVRENPAARTGYRRQGVNWPLFRPQIEPRFTLGRDAKIFTTGSCFARNIERSLAMAGFDAPAFGVVDAISGCYGDVLPDEPGVDIFNKYTPPSMYNDVRWHAESLDPLDVLYDREGLCWNSQIHLKSPGDPAMMRDITRRVFDYNRRVFSADLVVMTLGLVEAWYDRERGLYLNEKPPGKFALDPRFEFRTLGFEDCRQAVSAYITTVRASNPGVPVVITVSPVTLATTMRGGDVRVRNCYSKSLLRAVTEQVSLEIENVHYFPSYEMATLSRRDLVYAEDDIHIRQAFVDYIIFSFLQNYLRADELLSFGLTPIALSHALCAGDPAAAKDHFAEYRTRILEEDNIERLVLLYRYAELCEDKKTEKKAYVRLGTLLGAQGVSRIFGGWCGCNA